jgi:hypothetical protein
MKDGMKKTTGILVKMSSACALAGVLALAAGCYGEVDEGGAAYYPSDSFLVTGQPVYYEGHASYFYNGRWVYRDGGGRWNAYRSEPAFLAQRRGAVAAPRRTYERPAARGPGRR